MKHRGPRHPGGDMQQRSEAWYRERAGRITGSRFARAMAARSSDAFQGLIADLAEERRTGQSRDRGYVSAAMQWGIDHEGRARMWYCSQYGHPVREVGFVVHPVHDFVGVSPDGLVGDRGLIEIKCPQLANFNRVVRSQRMPARYRWQVQGQLWVCEREWLDFVCFYPPRQGVVIRVEADENDFDKIESRCTEVDLEVKRRVGIGGRTSPKSAPRRSPSPAPNDDVSVERTRTPAGQGMPGWIWVVGSVILLYWLTR